MKRFNVVVGGGIFTLAAFLAPLDTVIQAQEAPEGAYLQRINYRENQSFAWYVPPKAELTIVDGSEKVYLSVFDDGNGIITQNIPLPDPSTSGYSVFYSDGVGLSSRISWNFSQQEVPVLMSPTIYGITNINDQYGVLGFVGKAFPQSRIELEITLSTNEKTHYNSLANSGGEWQIQPGKLSPGKYQARAKATFQGLESAWSPEVSILVLAPADQFIQDLGNNTRSSINRVIEGLPGPVRQAAEQIDKRSDVTSKIIFPTLLTLSTLAQSGVLAQNVLYLLYQALIFIGQLLGIIKKKQPMGLIYDAISKKPLGRVIVRLYDSTTNALIETDVTSADGVFSFMPKEGFYYLKVTKPGYQYPSQMITSRRDGTLFPVYTGGDIRVGQNQEVVNVAVPLDPEAYQESWQMKVRHIWQRWFEPVNRWLLWFGFFLAILSYSRMPTKLNFAIFWLYAAGLLYFWRSGRRYKREFGLVVNKMGKPLPGVELILMDTEFNRLVSRRVTDDKGRYQFAVPPGTYQIRVVSTGYEMMTKVKSAYQGDEVKVEGERGQTKHVIPKIVVKAV